MADRLRWMKFWPADWSRDPALRMCGLAARGLWIEMIGLMHEAKPYGHLLVNGRAPTNRQIGQIVGVPERDAQRLLAELEHAGVFSRKPDDVIFSRRMERDHLKAEEGREAVGRRWAKKDEKVPGPDEPNTPPNRGPNRESRRGTNTLEAEAEAEAEEPSLRSGRGDADAGPASPPLDVRTALFREGLDRLRRLTGQDRGRGAALLGRLLKTAADDCAVVGLALAEAEELRPADPVPWLIRRVEGRTRDFASIATRKPSNLDWMAGHVTPKGLC